MLSKFSVKKPLTVLVCVIIVIILGVVSYTKMDVDLIPEMNAPYVSVITTYPGASPEQVETSVTNSLEQSLSTLSNLESITSQSSENVSVIGLVFNLDADMDSVFIEIRENIELIKSALPDEAGSPMIMKLDTSMIPVYSSTITVDNLSQIEASEYINNEIYPEIKSVDGISYVSLSGLTENMIDVTLSEEKINTIQEKYLEIFTQMQNQAQAAGQEPISVDVPQIDITTDMISGILKGQNFSMPAGSVSSDDGTSYLVRVGDKIQSVEELENLVLMEFPVLGEIKLSDVADINLYDNSGDVYSKTNGQNGCMIYVQKQPDSSTSKVCKDVNNKLNEIMENNPDVHVTEVFNQGSYIDLMISSIIKNLLFGALLAILILYFFLRKIKPTIIVSASIVIGVITAFVLMYFSGVTMNMISMGGLALGVGMLVDNSIVVIENIYRLRAEGKTVKEAAIEGAKEVAGAITASTLTTVVVFVPILFTDGITRQLFTDMALTITFSLVASLIVALTLVPAASSKMFKKEQNHKENIIDKLGNVYSRMLGSTIKHKWLSFVIEMVLVLGLLVGSLGAAMSNGFEMFPQTDSGELTINIDMPDNYTNEDTFNALDDIYEKLSTIPDVETVGIMFEKSDGMDMGSFLMGNGLSCYVALKENHELSTAEVSENIRDMFEDAPYKAEPSSSSMDMSMLTGSSVQINIYNNDIAKLAEATKMVSDVVSSTEGTTEIKDGLNDKTKDLKITVDKQKASLKGLTVAQVFMAVNNAIKSDLVITTISDGENDYDIYVKDDKDKVITDDTLSEITVESAVTGDNVKVSDIAQIATSDGLMSISHEDQERIMTVTASLENGYDVRETNDTIKNKIDNLDLPDGTTFEIAGENQAMNEAFSDIYLMIALAIVLIYLVMVAQFQSLISPFIIMFTIPLAFTGGFLGLFVTNTKVSLISLIGLLVLVGIVVNNGIVFVDYANQQVEKGKKVLEALVIAGRNRLRPILMTALTTIFALIITAFDSSNGGEMLQPVAITTIGGLIYATILTLFFVPILYVIFNSRKDKNK